MKTVFAVLALIAITLSAQGQGPTAEQLTQTQIDALLVGDWKKFTAQMHPKELTRFREIVLPVAEAVVVSNEKPAAVIWRNAFSTQPIAKIRSMTPTELFEMFMGNIAKMNPGFVENYKTMKVEFLGTIKEGKVVYLLSRNTRELGGLKVTSLLAASFEPNDAGELRVMLTGEIEQLVASLRKQFVK